MCIVMERHIPRNSRYVMKIYNVVGFAMLALQVLISALLAPPWLGPWWGIVVGFGYLLVSWFLGGLYLSDVVHLGIAHRARDGPEDDLDL
jgi:uncharacterized membrane protein (DUF485 family)